MKKAEAIGLMVFLLLALGICGYALKVALERDERAALRDNR